MPQTIFFRIGTRNRVPLQDFIGALQNFLGLLRDVDSTVANDKQGSVIWEVVSLKQNSPPIVGVTPLLRPEKQDMSEVVAIQVMDNIERLNHGGEPTKYMSFAGLTKIERLALKSRTLGDHEVFTTANGQPARSSIIAEPTLERVQQITGVSYSGYGSVSGRLEAISVHQRNEFRVWDDTTAKPVKCAFELNQEPKIINLFHKRVRVFGNLASNVNGIPIRIQVEDIEELPAASTLPTIKEMSGLVDNFTEGKPLKKYLEELSDE